MKRWIEMKMKISSKYSRGSNFWWQLRFSKLRMSEAFSSPRITINCRLLLHTVGSFSSYVCARLCAFYKCSALNISYFIIHVPIPLIEIRNVTLFLVLAFASRSFIIAFRNMIFSRNKSQHRWFYFYPLPVYVWNKERLQIDPSIFFRIATELF